MYARIVVGCLLSLAWLSTANGQRLMEKLSRGPVAVRQNNGSVFLSWRLLGSDPPEIAFNVYRQLPNAVPQRVNDAPLSGATNIVDERPTVEAELTYVVKTVLGGQEHEASAAVTVWPANYHEIPIQPIADYFPGDGSVGDLDGDGELEIVLHQSSRGRDNGSAGVTGTPIIDAYKLDGTHLWRIDLGKNIREGEHYTQFMVYDLDGDGRAELACKTADGTTDGQGNVIGDPGKDWRTLQDGSRRHGRILDGPEFFTIFDGRTGQALKTADYLPSRYSIDGWGGIGGNAGNDSYGNRCDRFLACVAYLDGERPSVVMCRGVYGRIVMAAWDWRNGNLSIRWVFDTGMSYPPYENASPFAGMGGHSLSVADVDDDGRDEIIYQAMVVDDNGKGLYSTGLRHGDVMYVADMYPDRPGLEVFSVQENEEHAELFQTPGAAMRDARSGEILWSHSPTIDVPMGVAADVDPRYRGFEAWGGPGGMRNEMGETVGPAPRGSDWTIWWDGDPLREFLSLGRARFGRRFGPRPTTITKWNWQREEMEPIVEFEGVTFSRGPTISGDLLGDWREEVVLVAPDAASLRVYTTTIPTDRRLPTLLHDPQYRLGLVWQNVVYNKPCYPSYYLGDGMAEPPRPAIRVAGGGESIAEGD